MAAKTVGESLSVLSLAGIATIRSLDGTVVQLPCAVLNRSTLLQHALSDSSEGGECYLRLPQGALEAWIHALKLAGVETGRVDQQASAKPPKGCTDEVGLIKCLQVRLIVGDTRSRARCDYHPIPVSALHGMLIMPEQQVHRQSSNLNDIQLDESCFGP